MRFLKNLFDFKKKEYEDITDDDIQDIKDIFQDEVDEYDLISLHDERASTILGDNLFNDSYHVLQSNTKSQIPAYLTINIYLSKIKKEELLLKSINKNLNRE